MREAHPPCPTSSPPARPPACPPQHARPWRGVRAPGRAAAAPICHLQALARQPRPGPGRRGSAGLLLCPRRHHLPGAQPARGAVVPHGGPRVGWVGMVCGGGCTCGLCCEWGGVPATVCARLLPTSGALAPAPTQRRCVYQLRAAFDAMQSDLDPLTRGQCRPAPPQPQPAHGRGAARPLACRRCPLLPAPGWRSQPAVRAARSDRWGLRLRAAAPPLLQTGSCRARWMLSWLLGTRRRGAPAQKSGNERSAWNPTCASPWAGCARRA